MTKNEFFIKLVLNIDGENEEVDVSNDSYHDVVRFLEELQTDEGIAMYLDSLDYDAELVSVDEDVYRRTITETIVSRHTFEVYED